MSTLHQINFSRDVTPNIPNVLEVDYLLHIAVCQNDLSAIRSLLERGFNINHEVDIQKIPFYIAMEFEVITLIEGIMQEFDYENVRQLQTWPVTALHMAAVIGDKNTVDLLIKKGAILDKKIAGTVTPLMLAVMCQHDVIVELLLDTGADVNSKTPWNKSVLDYAVQRCDFPLMKMLLKNGAKVNMDNKYITYVFHRAVHCEDLELMQLMLEQGFPVDQQAHVETMQNLFPNTQIFHAIVAKLHDMDPELRICLETWTMTALHVAVVLGNNDMIRLLLRYNPNLEIKMCGELTPVLLAYLCGYRNTMKLLKSCGANVTARTISCKDILYYALKMNDYEVANSLMTPTV